MVLVNLDRQTTQAAHRRQHQAGGRKQHTGCADSERGTHTNGVRKYSADQRTQRIDASEQQVHDRVHPSQQMVRCDGLAQAQLVDVVNRKGRVAELRRHQESDGYR